MLDLEFNPKGHSLLDDQLAESGLKMSLDPVIGAALIGGATSIFSGIFGASEADKQNQQAQAAQEEQQKLLNKQAQLQNDYNKQKFEADKENYRKQAEYNFQTAVKNWQYDMTIRTLQEKVDAQKYLMSVENAQKQLTFNEVAAQQSQSREQLALNDAKAEYSFQAQDQLVAQLQAQGKARLGQAGRSMQKRVQSSEAQIGRDLAVMSASLTGEINASHLRMFDINMGKFVADANVQAAMMLRPERLPDIPTPTKPPEPTWVEPMQIIPGMAAPAQQQSVAMPLIQGFGSAASNLASIDWSSGVGGGKQPQTYGTSGIPGITSGLSYSGPTSYAGVKF
jgi:hypothetical protein